MKKVLLIILLLIPIYINAEVVEFYKCVDGDTFKAKLNDEVITIRMLAVDTPESVHPTKGVEYYGKDASEYTCNILTNAKEINLEYDSNSDKTDKYSRYLAWVFVDDELLQDKLVRNGYAEVAYLYGNYKYTDLLKEHQTLAEVEKIGIWNEEEREKYNTENNITETETSSTTTDTSSTTTKTDTSTNTTTDTSTDDILNKIEEKYGTTGVIIAVMVVMLYSYLQKKTKRVK